MIHPTIAMSVRRHTLKETNTNVHQSVYLASSTQKIRNAMAKKKFVKSATGSSSARGVLRITLKIDPRLRVKRISFAILSKSA